MISAEQMSVLHLCDNCLIATPPKVGGTGWRMSEWTRGSASSSSSMASTPGMRSSPRRGSSPKPSPRSSPRSTSTPRSQRRQSSPRRASPRAENAARGGSPASAPPPPPVVGLPPPPRPPERAVGFDVKPAPPPKYDVLAEAMARCAAARAKMVAEKLRNGEGNPFNTGQGQAFSTPSSFRTLDSVKMLPSNRSRARNGDALGGRSPYRCVG